MIYSILFNYYGSLLALTFLCILTSSNMHFIFSYLFIFVLFCMFFYKFISFCSISSEKFFFPYFFPTTWHLSLSIPHLTAAFSQFHPFHFFHDDYSIKVVCCDDYSQHSTLSDDYSIKVLCCVAISSPLLFHDRWATLLSAVRRVCGSPHLLR